MYHFSPIIMGVQWKMSCLQQWSPFILRVVFHWTTIMGRKGTLSEGWRFWLFLRFGHFLDPPVQFSYKKDRAAQYCRGHQMGPHFLGESKPCKLMVLKKIGGEIPPKNSALVWVGVIGDQLTDWVTPQKKPRHEAVRPKTNLGGPIGLLYGFTVGIPNTIHGCLTGIYLPYNENHKKSNHQNVGINIPFQPWHGIWGYVHHLRIDWDFWPKPTPEVLTPSYSAGLPRSAVCSSGI